VGRHLFTKNTPDDGAQILDAILAQIPAITPDKIKLEWLDDNYWITLADDSLAPAVGAIVANHVHKPTVNTDWVGFRLAMLSDSGYQRIARLIQQGSPQSIEVFQIAISATPPNLTVAQNFWKQGLDMVWLNIISKPTVDDIARWNASATTYKAPLSFDSKGYILLK
jgi:hypothetical protein